MRLALERLEGVERAEVSFWKKKAVVRYDPKRVTPEQMIQAVREIGFGASLLQGGK
ncbi:MAG: cation transporter [Nitrospinota bacterium]